MLLSKTLLCDLLLKVSWSYQQNEIIRCWFSVEKRHFLEEDFFIRVLLKIKLKKATICFINSVFFCQKEFLYNFWITLIKQSVLPLYYRQRWYHWWFSSFYIGLCLMFPKISQYNEAVKCFQSFFVIIDALFLILEKQFEHIKKIETNIMLETPENLFIFLLKIYFWNLSLKFQKFSIKNSNKCIFLYSISQFMNSALVEDKERNCGETFFFVSLIFFINKVTSKTFPQNSTLLSLRSFFFCDRIAAAWNHAHQLSSITKQKRMNV